VVEKLIFERSRPGTRGALIDPLDVPAKGVGQLVPASVRRASALNLPEVSEPVVVRHFTNLSVLNHHVDRDFYPLGSCTMKYNPKINDRMAGLPGFAALHPLAPEASAQGALALLWELERALAEITGLPAVSLQPAAGAQGELTAMMIARAYHRSRNEDRNEVIIPDSAHGTNPASVAMAGMKAVEVKSNAEGKVDLQAVEKVLGPRTAAMMLTNPNTVGIFETQIEPLAKAVHAAGGLMYLDGANMNALVGFVRPGDMGFDMMHLNLHKTFSTPHGGGGPGAGPVAVRSDLAPFLPAPTLVREGDTFRFEENRPYSVGRMHGFVGNFLVLVRALAYIRSLGATGLQEVSRNAILNANYLLARLSPAYAVKYPGPCMHEFVLSAVRQKKHGVRAADVSKRLLDFGFHAPTTYFPLIVEEALMIEPTESEPLGTLDRFADVMIAIAEEAERDPEMVRGAPHTTPVIRPDEARAARQLRVKWTPARDDA
jgi:glycine cleavage system P protein (glycine dehydrogenase) subunit 2